MTKASKSTLHQDKRGGFAQAMRPVKGSAYDVAYTGTKGVTAEITEECVRVRCTSDAYVLIGQNADITPSSSAYDYFCAAGEAVDIKLFDTDKYIAAVQVSSGGTMYVNGWK